jgi:hypothetical protein
VLYLDVSKVDLVLYLGYVWEARGGTNSPHAGEVRATRAPLGVSDAGAVERCGPICGQAKQREKTDCSRGRLSEQLGACSAATLNFLATWLIHVIDYHSLRDHRWAFFMLEKLRKG